MTSQHLINNKRYCIYWLVIFLSYCLFKVHFKRQKLELVTTLLRSYKYGTITVTCELFSPSVYCFDNLSNVFGGKSITKLISTLESVPNFH